MHDLQQILMPYEQAIDLIHRASLFLEMAFRRTHDALRTAQCELPLNEKHGARLKASSDMVTESLCKIYSIQETCDEVKKLMMRLVNNGNEEV